MIKKIKKLDTVILGCGEIAGFKNITNGSILNHANEIKNNKNFKLICNIERDKNKREKFRNRYKIPKSFNSIDALIKSKIKSDLIVICTKAKNHYSSLVKLIDNNFKNILCEKPICENKLQLKRLVKLSRKKKVNIFVNFNRKEDNQVKKLKNEIKKNKFGKVMFVNCVYSKGILNNGIHLVDLLLFLFNKLKIIKVFKENTKKKVMDKPMSFILRGDNKFPIFVNNLTNKNFSIFEIDIIFEKGRLKYCDNGLKILQYKTEKNKYFKNKMKLISKPLEKKTEFLKSFRNQYVNIHKKIFNNYNEPKFSKYEKVHNLCFDIINKS